MKEEGFGKMPDKTQERIAEELRAALFDFLSAVKQGVVSPAQRSALERALTNAKEFARRPLLCRYHQRRASTRRTGLDPLARALSGPPVTLGNVRELDTIRRKP
jgi:hypothetical protein